MRYIMPSRQLAASMIPSGVSMILYVVMFLCGAFFVSAAETTPTNQTNLTSVTLVATSSEAISAPTLTASEKQTEAEVRANRLSTILASLDGLTASDLQSTEATDQKALHKAKQQQARNLVSDEIASLKAKHGQVGSNANNFKTRALEEFASLKRINDTLKASLASAGDNGGAIEPSYLMTLQDIYIPNDPELNQQWYIARILETTKKLWFTPASTQNPPIIAVIDAGVDFTHPDLTATKWQSTTCANERGEQIGTCTGGYDFVDNDTHPYPSDNATHGTAVASLIAATTDNEIGMASLSRGNAKIMSLRVAENGVLETDDIVRAILFAVHNGAEVINMSFAGPTHSAKLEAAILYAQDHGVVMVAAAGNAGLNLDTTPIYPASFTAPYLVTVGALDEAGNVTSWSNYGKAIDVFAPGARVLAASSNSSYSPVSGTSFAAPITLSYITTKMEQGIGFEAALKELSQIASLRKVSATGAVLGTGKAPLGQKQPKEEVLTALQQDASGQWFNPQSKAGEYVTDPKKFTLEAINYNLGLPTLISPGNTTQPGPSISSSGSVTFTWGSRSGVYSYGVYVRDLTTNTLIVDCERCTTGTSRSFTGFVAGRQYRWNMNSWDSAGNNSSAYTNPFYFTVAVPTLAAPGALTPGATSANGTLLTSTTQTLTWTAVTGATGYEVEFTNTSTGAVSNYTTTALTRSVSTPQGQNFKWRVRTKNSAGQYGSYSTFRYFQIQAAANTAPSVPSVAGSGAATVSNGYVIGFATNDAQNDQVKFEVRWNAGASTAFSTYGYYASGVTSGNATNIYTTAGTYCIQARAIDALGNASAYSPCHNVVVSVATAAPTLSVTPTTQAVTAGANAIYTVATTNVASCRISGNGLTNFTLSSVNATYTVGPNNSAVTYTVNCTGTNGTAISRSFNVTISTAASPLVTFNTIPSVVNGTAFTLGFSTANIPTGSVITLTPSMGNITPSTITLSGSSFSGSATIKSATGGTTIRATYNGTTAGTSNTFTVGNGTTCTASLQSLANATVVTNATIPSATNSTTIDAANPGSTGSFEQSGLCAPANPLLPEPYLITPGTQSSPGTQYSTTSLSFQMTPVAGATGYEIYLRNIATNQLYTFPVTSSSVKISGLGFSTQWRWNAAAKGSDGALGWVTDVNYFTIGAGGTGAPTFTLTPSTQTIASGGTASLVLATTYVSSCTLSGGGFTNYSWGTMVNGTLNINNITAANTTYSITCLGQNGTSLTRTSSVVVSATAPKITFSTIGSQVTGTVFPITLTAANILSGGVIDLTVSAGTLHTRATTQYPITYTKNVTLSGTSYTGNINVTSVATGARTLTARYNGTIVGTSNSFTLTAPCTSTLTSLTEASGDAFTLESICTPSNPSLLPPTQVSPGVAQSSTQPNGTTVGATTQTFGWNAVSGASKYALYVRNLDTDVLEVNNENVTGTSFTSNVLKSGAKYKWNVRAIDSTGKGGWISDGLWFTVQSGVTETPLTGSIQLLVVDETNDPISNVPIEATCYTLAGVKCADQTQLQLLNPITDTKGSYLFHKNVYSSYDQLKTSVTVNGVTQEAVTAFSLSVTKEVILKFIREIISDLGVIAGLLNGAYTLLEASYQMVMHPIATANGIYVALSDLSGTGNAIYEGLKGRYVEIVYVDVNNYVSIYNSGKAFGQTAFDACTVGCTLGGGIAIKGVQVGKISVDVSSTASKAAAIEKIAKALKDANIVRVVNQFTSATNIDDIANIARNNRINSTTESAYVIPGNKEAALLIAEKFGWTKFDTQNSNGTLITYTSPDELQRITYREFSTSNVPEYNLEATLDLLVKNGNNYDLVREVKFVTK